MIDALRVAPGSPPGIAARDPRDDLGLGSKEAAKRLLAELTTRLSDLQERLYAERTRSVLVVLQGLDASGKDGVIRSRVHRRQPARRPRDVVRRADRDELAHDYLWRIHAALPREARSASSTARTTRTSSRCGCTNLAPEDVWRRRPGHIRAWEEMLVDEGTAIVKVFLNVRERSSGGASRSGSTIRRSAGSSGREDLEVRERFDEYVAAWEEASTETSTDWAPWYVVPADRNWVKSTRGRDLVVDALERLDPQAARAASRASKAW